MGRDDPHSFEGKPYPKVPLSVSPPEAFMSKKTRGSEYRQTRIFASPCSVFCLAEGPFNVIKDRQTGNRIRNR
jgi:hypothetical protein